MADIKQRISIDGADQAKRDLAGIGEAGKQAFAGVKQAADQAGDIGKSFNFDAARQQVVNLIDGARSLLATLDNVASSASNTGAQIRALGNDAAGAGRQAADGASQFSSIALKAAGTAGAIAGIGLAIFQAAKKAADGAKEIADAADKSGASLESFQQAKFILQQMGLSADDAATAIKSLADKSTEATKNLVDRIAALGFRFVDAGDEAKFVKEQVERLGGSNPALDPLLAKLRGLGFAIPAGTTDELKNVADLISRLSASQGIGGALGKLKDQTPDVIASLKATADAIAAFSDEGLQKQAAINAFGDELGPKLVDKLKEGSKGVDEFIKDFENLSLGIKQGAVDLSTTYGAAMARFTQASETARVEFGARFLPIVTEGIKQFTNLMRLNKGPLDEFAKSTAASFTQLAQDIFAIFNGEGSEIKTGWLVTIRDLVVGVAIPALKGLAEAAQPVIDKINALFGTKFTVGGAALTAILASLLGGFNSLLLVVTALFTGSSPLLDKFRQGLASIGINLDGIKAAALAAFDGIRSLFTAQGSFATPFGRFSLDANVLLQTILAIVAAFIILKKGGELVAPVLSAAVGRTISGEAVIFAGVIGQITGITQALTTVMIGAAAASTLLRNGLATVGVLLRTAAFLVGWPAVLAAGIILAIAKFDKFVAVLDPIAKILNSLFGTDFFTGTKLAVLVVGGLASAFVILTASEIAAGVALGSLGGGLLALATRFGIPLAALGSLLALFGDLNRAADPFEKAMDDLTKKFNDGKISQEQYNQQLHDMQAAYAAAGKGAEDSAAATKGSFGGLASSLNSVWDTLTQRISGVTEKVAGVGQKAAAVGTVFEGFKRTSENTWTFVGDGAAGAAQKVGAVADKAGDLGKALDGTSSIADRFKEAFAAVGSATDGVTKSTPALAAALAQYGATLDGLKQKASSLGDTIRAALANFNPIGSAQAAEGAAAGPLAGGGGSGVVEQLLAPFTAASEKVKALWAELAAFLADPSAFAGMTALEDAITAPFLRAAGTIRVAWQSLATDVEGVANRFKTAFDAVGSATDGVAKSTPALTASLAQYGGALDSLQQKATALGEAIRSALSAFNPAGAVPAAGAGAGGSGGVVEALLAPFAAASEEVKALWAELAAFLADPSAFAGMTALEDAIAAPFVGAGATIRAAWQSLATDVEGVIARLLDAARQTLSSLTQVASAAASVSSGITAGPVAGLAGGAGGLSETLLAPFAAAAEKIKALWGELAGFISDPARFAGLAALVATIEAPFAAAAATIRDAWQSTASAVEGVVSQIVAAANQALSSLQQVAAASASLRASIAGAGPTIGQAASADAASAGAASGGAIAALIAPFQAAADKIKELWAELALFLADPSRFADLAALETMLEAPFIKAARTIVDAWGFLAAGLPRLFDAFPAILQSTLMTPFVDAARTIVSAWSLVAGALPGLFDGRFAGLESTLAAPFEAAAAAVTAAWQSAAGQIEAIVFQIISGANQALAVLQQLAGAAANAGGAGGGGGGGGFDSTAGSGATFAGGGLVSGPGSTTSDSILAWLSDQEFVQPAARVFQYGRDFMEAIRAGVLPIGAVRALMSNMRGFHAGGLVERLAVNFAPVALPRFADGGQVSAQAGALAGLHPVHLHWGNGETTSGLFGKPSAVAELARRASIDRLSSAGPAPGWAT